MGTCGSHKTIGQIGPAQASVPRFFPGQRWVNIGLRSLHLLGVAGMGAGLLTPGILGDAWQRYLILTMVTGIGMTLIDAWSNRRWLVQLSGQVVLFKLLLLGLIPLLPAAGPALFAAVILISAFISHAPAWLRHYVPFHGYSLERPNNRRAK